MSVSVPFAATARAALDGARPADYDISLLAGVQPHLRVLVVDDDLSLCTLVMEALAAEGYLVREVHTGVAALDLIRAGDTDAVVLDLGLPEMSGFDVLTAARRFTDIPILILSARTEEGDRIQGLRLGADDFMVKPCSTREITARVATVLRRARPVAAATTLDFDGLHIDVAAHEILIDGQSIDLTPREFELLVCLARTPRVVVSRADLLRTVWASCPEWQTPATVTEHVRRLRAKIERAPEHPRWVVTIRGLGYRFEPRNARELALI